jgi:hypothetical protein
LMARASQWCGCLVKSDCGIEFVPDRVTEFIQT